MGPDRAARGSERTRSSRVFARHSRHGIGALVVGAIALLAGAAPALAGGGAPIGPGRGSGGAGDPLGGRAVWIWELADVDGGDLPEIAARAHRYGVRTVIVKSSDGTSRWSAQFDARLVRTLHADGLRVCAWQYVYGNHPVIEAHLGADAVHDGADCLVIDAESEYEGKYVAAQTYVRTLRALVGYRYPVALAGFPYVDLHPAFPYSVFLGPGGAQYDAPQMYWRDIRTSPDEVFAHTYADNLIYGRPIYPLGQVYANPPARQIIRFRELSRAYGAPGVSWWDWQEARPAQWTALSEPAGALAGYVPDKEPASIGPGLRSDRVVWAQEHLISAGYDVAVSGRFGAITEQDVIAFQTAHGLTPDGVIGPETWAVLLRYRAARVRWVHVGRTTVAQAARRTGRPPLALTQPTPVSASARPRREEIPGSLGAGRP